MASIVAHKFPKPLWNQSGVPIEFDEKLTEALRVRIVPPSGIVYIPNEKILGLVTDIRYQNQQAFTEKCVTTPFPKAVHGPDMQSMTVYSKDELDRALKAGWSLRPVGDPDAPADAPLSPDTPPRPKLKKSKELVRA